MKMEPIENPPVSEARHVDVVTCNISGTVVGYRIQGSKPGPNVLVAGYSPNADLVYERLFNLPTLPWMQGSLCLIMLNTFDDLGHFEPVYYGPTEEIDEILFLPYAGPEHKGAEIDRDGYWAILRLCGRLGMIEGRGVLPPR